MRARPLWACAGLLLLQTATSALAQTTAAASANNPLDICALPVTRLVFTLADLSNENCGSDVSQCTSLCWCRAWASTPATTSTLALCVSVNSASTCSGESFDCRAALASQNATAGTNSSGQALHTIDSNDESNKSDKKGGISTTVSIVIAASCAAVLALLVFVANWYRHRPKSVSGPATVSGGVQTGPPLTLTEIDDYDDKLPDISERPSHRRSHEAQGPMQFDANASVISGVSGTSYHDLDNTKLGHVNEDLAITDTELSLSRDATRRAFSPATRGESFLSDDSMDVAPLGRGQDPPPPTRPYLQDDSSTFISVASTSYLTRYNESFSSQLTMPESEADSLADSFLDSDRSRKEVEF